MVQITEINEDLLNTKLNTKLENDNLLIEVKANKSYLLKL